MLHWLLACILLVYEPAIHITVRLIITWKVKLTSICFVYVERERDLHSRINMRLVGSIEWPSIFVMGVCKHRDHPAQYILSKEEYWWNSSLLKVLQYLSAMPVKTLPSIKRISRYMQQTICRNWLWHFSFRLIWLVFLIATSILL